MRKLTPESAIKLRVILEKRLGRKLTDIELEEAYDALMDFAFALVDLNDSDLQSTVICPQETIDNNQYLAV